MPQKDRIKAKASVARQQIGSLLLCKVFHSLVIKLSFPGFHLINWTQRLATRKWRGSNGSPPIGPFASISGGFDAPAAARSRTPGCYLRRAFDCGSKQSGRGRSDAAALHWQRRGSEGERDKEEEICAEATAASKQRIPTRPSRAIFSVSARPSAIRHHSSKITRSNRREKPLLVFFPPRV